jgi:putative glutamine amidotransferase
MARPLIGLTGRRKPARDVAGFPESLHQLPVDLYLAGYAQGVIEAGGIPLHLPLDLALDDIESVLQRLDGMVFTGGADIDPSEYGAAPSWMPYDSEPLRDAHERSVLATAIGRGLPTLGICRGLQLLNVQQGGTLHQDVPAHARYDVPPDHEAHDVRFVEGSQLHRLYGPTAKVNTLHHQTIDRLGSGLTIGALADDGTIEAIELQGKPVLAVQWHPEMMQSRAVDPAFAWLVQTASA